MLFSLLMACWMDSASLPALNINVINFTNEYLETDVEVRIYDSPLLCPDGVPASFFLVRPISEEPVPVAVVFHSGAMWHQATVADTAMADDASTFRAGGRLRSEWASSRVWETLNLSRKTLDTAVTDLGYLPTALANQGIAQLYPTNCWGDLWHNGLDIQPNNADTEGFSRQGLDMAQFAINILTDTALAEETGFIDVQDKLDSTGYDLIGLGTGGQAIVSLLAQGATPNSVLFDSTPATFEPYFNGDFPSEQESLTRIFGSADVSAAALNVDVLPSTVGWIWSNGDTQHPIESIEAGSRTLSELEGAWVVDQNSIGHVFSNRDFELAQTATTFVSTGELPVETDSTDATETE